jgi:hypothetical protein
MVPYCDSSTKRERHRHSIYLTLIPPAVRCVHVHFPNSTNSNS